MNKLKLFTGGFLLRNDDFDFLQDSISESFKAMAVALAKPYNGYLVLSGCEITNVSTNNGFEEYEVQEGYMIYDNEILYCPYQQSVFAQSGAPLEFILDVTMSGTRNYANSQSHETYETRRVIVQEFSQNGLDTSNAVTLKQAIADLLVLSKTENQLSFSGLNNWNLYQGSAFEVIKEGSVKQLVCTLDATQTFINAAAKFKEVMFNLPVQFRPTRDVEYVCQVHGSTNQAQIGVCIVKVYTNGDVEITKTNSEQNQYIVPISIVYI